MTAVEARQYLAKAEEFLTVAEECVVAGYHIAATGNAVHAAINAADAVCGIRMGQRSAGQAHDETLDLLREAGRDGVELAKHLARLLPLKTRAEYEPDDVPKGVASKAVESARKALTVARRVVAPK
ncbi:MAG TPA: HEPN domain-containing protein [Acidimicrobiales bacterium]|nr:HEPN domain-containing protein [Acidimicrobiales bacterium]